jgi:hypothetical protein
MKQRCTNPHNSEWAIYGGRGITVYPPWSDFAVFLADMGVAPPNTTIERVNGNRGYEPGNCVWATATEQARNTTRNRFVTHDGVTKCVAEWAQVRGIPRKTLMQRLNYGWPAAQALEFERREGKNMRRYHP